MITLAILIFIFFLSLIPFVFILAIFEYYGIRKNPLYYRLGIPVYRQTFNLPNEEQTFNSDKHIFMNEGEFKFTKDSRVFFSSQMLWNNPFRLRTYFQLKGIGIINENKEINISARIPLYAFMFYLILIICMVAGSYIIYDATKNVNYLLAGLGILIFLIVWITLGYLAERGRWDKVLEELNEILSRYGSF